MIPAVVLAAAVAATSLADVDVTEHLGDHVPLDLAFTAADGSPTTLADSFDGTHPVLVVLAYYECPQLCSLVLDAATRAMVTLDDQGWHLGDQYRAVTISFDATERIDQAARKQAAVVGKLPSGGPWPFLVGGEHSVTALTDALGFRFARDPATGALAHPAVAFVLTPDGRISRYLYGFDYAPRDLKLALLEASDGKTGSFGDRVLLRCFHYDPTTRRYGLFVARFMQIGGGVILLCVIAMLVVFGRMERRR